MRPSLAALFEPFGLRELRLENRVVMAPMTRGFSPNGVPGADVAAYYRRRAEAGVGLILTEGVGVSGDMAGQKVLVACVAECHVVQR